MISMAFKVQKAKKVYDMGDMFYKRNIAYRIDDFTKYKGKKYAVLKRVGGQERIGIKSRKYLYAPIEKLGTSRYKEELTSNSQFIGISTKKETEKMKTRLEKLDIFKEIKIKKEKEGYTLDMRLKNPMPENYVDKLIYGALEEE